MKKIFGLLPNKSEPKLESLIPLLEDGLMRRKLNLSLQLPTTDFTIMDQLLEHLEMVIKKVIKESHTVTVVFHRLNKMRILLGKNNTCNNNSLMLPLFLTLVAELIGGDPIFANWWMIPSMERLKKLLLPTEICYVDSVSNYWNKSLKYVKSNSWFSIKMSKNHPQMNWQKIYYQLYMSSIVSKWVNEDMVQPIQNALIKFNNKNLKKEKLKKPVKKQTKKTPVRKQKRKQKKIHKKQIQVDKEEPLNQQKIIIEKKEHKRKYNKKPKAQPIEKSPMEEFDDIYNKELDTIRNKKIRIYPDKNQRRILKKWIGTYRFTYNYTKDMIIKHKNKKDYFMLRDAIVTEKDNKLMNDKKFMKSYKRAKKQIKNREFADWNAL